LIPEFISHGTPLFLGIFSISTHVPRAVCLYGGVEEGCRYSEPLFIGDAHRDRSSYFFHLSLLSNKLS